MNVTEAVQRHKWPACVRTNFDGFSIGSNDLTQLTLSVDRGSEIMAFDCDERDPGSDL